MSIRTVSACGLLAALVFAVGFREGHRPGLDSKTTLVLSQATEHNAHAGRLQPNATLTTVDRGGAWTLILKDDVHARTRCVQLHIPSDAKAGDDFRLAGADGSDAWVEYRETDDVSGATQVWVATTGEIHIDSRFPKIEVRLTAGFEPSTTEGNGAEGSFTLAGTVFRSSQS